MKLKLYFFFPMLLISPALYSMQAARRLFSKLCTATQVGIVGTPFAFAATHKAADYINPNAATDHLPDAPQETQNYIRSILAMQNVANPEQVHIKVSNSEFAENFKAENSLFKRTLVVNAAMAKAIEEGAQLHQDLTNIPFPEKAHIAAQAQRLNQNSTAQEIAALASAPIIAHTAMKATWSPVRKAWDRLIYGPEGKAKRYSFWRSCLRLPMSPVKLGASAAIAALAYRTIEQRAENATNLNSAELLSAATFYANENKKLMIPALSYPHWHVNRDFAKFRAEHGPVMQKIENSLRDIENPQQKDLGINILSAAIHSAPYMYPVFGLKPTDATRAGNYWTRSQNQA